MKKLLGFIITISVFFTSSVLANEAPVVDATTQGANVAPITAPSPADTAVQNDTGVPADTTTANQNTNASQSTTKSHITVIDNPFTQSTASVTATNPASTLTTQQRVTRLEQQMSNLVKMNLPQQISDMRQSLQQMQGQLQVQAHDLKLLNSQQRSFYQDLDQRIKQLQNLSGTGSDGSTNRPSSAIDNQTSIQLKDSSSYTSAFNLLSKRRYNLAKTAFQNYISQYPNGRYQPNAHYWLGEIFLLQKDRKTAAKQFQIVISKYAKSNKVPDAKLKLAIIHVQMGKLALARRELLGIKKQHPNTTAAQLATIQLQQMNAGKGIASGN